MRALLAPLFLPAAVAAGLFTALPVAAQLPTLVPAACQGTASLSECGLNEAVEVFINIAQFIFGISGSVALIMFVWGGFLWLTSAGNAEKVKQGQAVIVGAEMGLIIIFGAYVGVQFLLSALRGTVGAGDVLIVGESCELSSEAGAQEGMSVATGRESAAATGGMECIAFDNCGALSDLGYEVINLSEVDAASYDCVNGLMRSSPENVKCCKLREGAVPGRPGGATGTCHCYASGSGLARDLGALSDETIEQARSACTSAGGTFDAAALECTGPSTEAECREVDAALPDPVSCEWTAGEGAPEGVSGRNNCTCADRGVNAVSTCAGCLDYCTRTRGSTMTEFNGESRDSCS